MMDHERTPSGIEPYTPDQVDRVVAALRRGFLPVTSQDVRGAPEHRGAGRPADLQLVYSECTHRFDRPAVTLRMEPGHCRTRAAFAGHNSWAGPGLYAVDPMGLIERIAPLVPNDRVVFSYSVSADLDEWAHYPFFKRDGRLVPDGRGWGQVPDDDPEATGDPREDYEGFTQVEITPWSILVQEPQDLSPPLAFRLHELLLDLIAGGTLVRVPDPGESALPWDRDPETLAAVVAGVFAELAAWRRANPAPRYGPGVEEWKFFGRGRFLA